MTTTINTLMRQLKGNEALMCNDFDSLFKILLCIDNPVNWALIAVKTRYIVYRTLGTKPTLCT